MTGFSTTLLSTAIAAAEAAAEVHRRHSARMSRVGVSEASQKGRADYVSAVDVEAEEVILAIIRQRFPDHQILAEESNAEDAENPLASDVPTWIVDPLDGTANYLHGHPMFASSVAVAIDGHPVAGAVVAAATGERWSAARGAGAWKNGRPIHVSTVDDYGHAMVGTGFPFKVPSAIPEYVDQLGRVLGTAAGVRRCGAAALDLCYLASGTLDAFWELFLSPWDYAAGWIIVEEAGGVLSRVDGSPLTTVPGSVLGANSAGMLDSLGKVVRRSD